MKARNLLVLMFVMAFSFITIAVSNQEVLAQVQPQQDESTEIVHPIPQIPIVLDGVKMSPEEITKFDGQVLYYIVDKKAQDEGVVYVYTTLDSITRHYESTKSKDAPNFAPTGCLNANTAWKDKWHNDAGGRMYITPGDEHSFATGQTYASFNNNIESTHVNFCSNYLKLYDNTDYTGSQLWLATNGWTGDLGIYGWNNRAGSVRADVK